MRSAEVQSVCHKYIAENFKWLYTINVTSNSPYPPLSLLLKFCSHNFLYRCYLHLWDKETLKRTYTISLNTEITNCTELRENPLISLLVPPPLKRYGRRGGHCHIKTILRYETSFLKYLDEQKEKKMLYS